MKRSNIGIKDIATFENAEDAYRKARKCKRYREEVLRFTDNLEEELYDLVADLEAGTYRQGEARRFVVYEPKKRRQKDGQLGSICTHRRYTGLSGLQSKELQVRESRRER